jgi:type IV secretory pathway VirB4 component
MPDAQKPANNQTQAQTNAQNNKDLTTALEMFQKGAIKLQDIVAPAFVNVTNNHIRLNEYYLTTMFAFGFPRYLSPGWFNDLINKDSLLDISMFIYPQKNAEIMKDLRHRLASLEATWRIEKEKGLVSDPELETALQDIEEMRFSIQRGEVKLFLVGFYITIYAKSLKRLRLMEEEIESDLAGKMVIVKPAIFRNLQGLNSTLPTNTDELQVWRNFDTASLSTFYPFVHQNITSTSGILYGVNSFNSSLVIFDRFKLANANSIIFAASGSGKSYLAKLEALRYLIQGTDVLVIDPEGEYENLSEAAGGTFVDVSLKSLNHINPFDLPQNTQESGEDILREAIIRLKGLISLMVGGKMTAEEEGILEKALYETYALKDIGVEVASQKNPAPLISDLQKVLASMDGGGRLATLLDKYARGTFAQLFNNATNVDLSKNFIVFGIKNLEEELRPIAMYMILGYVWNMVKQTFKKRLMIIDEAWLMMQHEDSAQFIYSLAKRARKYWLGLTVISQDVEDFLNSPYGRAVVYNSALSMLLKQTAAASDKVAEVFHLHAGEKSLLVNFDVGQSLLIAGQQKAVVDILASYHEHKLITTNPEEVSEQQLQNAPTAETETGAEPNAEAAAETPSDQTTPVNPAGAEGSV